MRLLVLADLTGLLGALLLSGLVSSRGGLAYLLTLPVWLVAARFYGLYTGDKRQTNHSTIDEVAKVFHLVTVGSWVAFLASSAFSQTAAPGRLIGFWGTAIALIALNRSVARTFSRRRASYIQNAVIVGAGDIGQLIGRKLLQHPEYGIKLVGFVDAEPKELRSELAGVDLLGAPSDLRQIVEQHGVDRVVIAFSNDPHGELLDAIHLYRERLGDLHPEIQCFVADLANAAARRWREKDAGMWEMRGDPRHHVASKVHCWVALDRAVRLAPRLGEHARDSDWAAERDAVRDAILEDGWHGNRAAFTQSFGSEQLDAAALLMPLVGFLPATDDRMRSTIEAIADELTEDGLVLRYRSVEGVNADGLPGDEGTFVICSFWLVSCLAQLGEIDRATALFERLVSHANDVGLLAEEIDHRTGELLGNFPQAFSHVGLITAAWQLDRARTESPETAPT